MKDFKLLPINLFGELLQCLYDSEVNFAIDWTWDGGFGWEFAGLKKSLSTNALAMKADHTNLAVVGGLILHEYMAKFDGLDSEGKPNEMYHFLGRNGFLDMQYKWFQGGGFLIRYRDRDFELLEVPTHGGEAQSIGFFTIHTAAMEYADKLSQFMKLALENTERGIEIHNDGEFVAEVVREDEGIDIVQTYNRAKSLGLVEVHGVEKTVWGLATNSNPDDTEFFEMPKQTAISLLNYINSR